MAWISVDQRLLGGKLRKLYKAIGCSRNEAVGILVSLWLWGVDNTDEEGLIQGADRDDLEETISVGLSEKLDPSAVLKKLIDTGWLDKTEHGFQIHDWYEWRKYYNRYLKEKKDHAERTRRYRERNQSDGESDVHSDVTVTSQESEAEESIKEPEPAPKTEKYSTDFAEFWSVYPRKSDKGMAYKKYRARRNDGYTPEQLLQAAEAYAEECRRNRTDQKYIKHAKTFLGDALPFEDYLGKPGPWVRKEISGTYGAGSGEGTGADENPFRDV